MSVGTPKPGRRGRGSRSAVENRARLFAANWLCGGLNGREAARAAGYRGTAASLDCTASRLLRCAKVKRLIEGHVQKAERALRAEEAIDRLSDIARLPDTGLADMADFITLVRPEEAAKRRDPARAAGCGFYIDLDKALRLGKTRLIKELSHDAETGAPGIKLQDNLAVWELSRKALSDLATIYGLKKGVEPPEPPKLELWSILELLPNEVLAQLKKALVDAREKAGAPPAEAQPVP